MRDVDEGCALVARLRREAVDQCQLGGARRATEGAAPDEVARSCRPPLDSSASSASASARPSTKGSFSIASA